MKLLKVLETIVIKILEFIMWFGLFVDEIFLSLKKLIK